MNQKERVDLLRQHFPGYDAPLDSKAMRPQIYGISHTSKAREILKGCKKEKSPVYKLTIRLDRGQEKDLRNALKGKEPAEWVREMICRKIEKAARLLEQTERQMGINTNKNISQVMENVK